MDREPVDSKAVTGIGYDEGSGTLEIEFKNGGIYQYYNVPKPIYDELMTSASKGQFVQVYIKPAYPWSKV